jgi:CheY-like chemotaxis protein
MLRCQIAADFEHKGQYESARDALGELWQGVGQRPALEGLSELTAADVLLRAGTLSGWFGSVQQIEGVQDAAKDLISESIARFQSLGETTKVVIAQSELGFCYRRAAAYDEARVIYNEALKGLIDSNDIELKAKILLRLVIVESCSGRYNESLRLLTDSTKLFEESTNDALKGKFHNELGLVLRQLGTAESRPDYTDRAIIEYTAAAHFFEQAGHTGYRASAENNLGFLLYLVGRYQDAHEHLNRARRLFLTVKDKGRIAQVDDARARVLLAEGRLKEAERASRNAVEILSKGGEQGLYAEALTTQGRVLAKLGNFTESQATLRCAADLAAQAGAVEDAGRALLTLIEEHAHSLTEYTLLETYARADDLLNRTQDAETITRLRQCARYLASSRLSILQPQRWRSRVDFWANFDLPEKIHAYEARYIKRALIDAQGSVTRAARFLGLQHHATLSAMLHEQGGRHKDLSYLRTPREPRRKTIIRDRSSSRTQAKTHPATILHVEDNNLVAEAVKDTLKYEGYKVEICGDGITALSILQSTEPYALLILDNELPGVNGIELTSRARQIPHRRRTPIIMLSASDCEREAWRAGVDAFLRKPEQMLELTATIKRILSK